jgi:DNA-binding NtrC family response regulator
MAPGQAHPVGFAADQRAALRSKRILVADADDSVRSAAHSLLERYGCIVETVRTGAEATCMVRAAGAGFPYDVIIADIRLSDITGYELFLKLGEVLSRVPLVLMTGFGYDPGHSIVKARQAGLKEVLYKPFRLDQLLDTVERVVNTSLASPCPSPPAGDSPPATPAGAADPAPARPTFFAADQPPPADGPAR